MAHRYIDFESMTDTCETGGFILEQNAVDDRTVSRAREGREKGVIIYGLSNAGFRIMEFLVETGVPVTIVAREHSRLLEQTRSSGVLVVTADTNSLDTLNELDLRSAGSIIFPSEDDQFNIHAAMRVNELNPGMRIVVRVFNMKFAGELEKRIPGVRAISVSQVATPSFAVSALVRDSILSFRVDNATYTFYEVKGDVLTGGTEKSAGETEAERNIRIVAIDGTACPGTDEVIGHDARVLCFSSFAGAKKLSGIIAPLRPGERRSGARKGRRFRPGLLLSDKVLFFTLVTLLGILLFSIFFFAASEKLSFINAVYFVVTVLTTVGFGDISLRESSTISKVVGIVLMLSGAMLMAILFAFITDSMIKKRLEILMGRRKMHIRDHVIVCGLGDVGARILENLVELGEDVVVVEKNPQNRFIQRLRDMGVPFIVSDATLEDSLAHAGAGHAKAIVCSTDNDLMNLEAGLNAAATNGGIRTVLRIFDEDFARMIRKNFSIDDAVSSSYIASAAFASAALMSDVINAFDSAAGKIFVSSSRVGAGEAFGPALKELGDRVLMVRDTQGNIRFGRDHTMMHPGDTVYYISPGGRSG